MTDNEARRRAGATQTVQNDELRNDSIAPKQESKLEEKSKGSSISIVDILRMLTGIILLSAALSWFITGESIIWNWRQLPTVLGAAKRYMGGPVMLTDAELSAFDGTNPKKPIYVGLNGSIYDVSASAHTYGPGGSYSFFAGKDAARAFITGCFQEDITPDLRGVEEMYIPIDPPSEVLTKGQLKIRREKDLRVARKRIKEGIEHWVEVFSGETGKPYFYVGQIKREKGWLEKLPKRELCQAAKDSRPKREDAE